MQTLVERGCRLDVRQATVVACLLIVLKNGKVQKQIRTFGTTTRELVSLRQWLLSEGCTHVAMESTGVYWKPIYAILEGAFEIVVANAQHVKKVPGRKTDVKDTEWIADLLCHGLLRSSFVPPKPIRELRDLTRYRRKLVDSQSAERNRLLKLLESANIKLASVASDVFGVSGLLMLQALVEGKASPQEMAELAKKQLRKKIPELELALEGKVEEHHRFLLRLQLRRLQAVEEDLGVLEHHIPEKLKPYAAELTLLDEIPGYAGGSTDDRHFRGTSRLVRRKMYDAGVRPEAAILEGFRNPIAVSHSRLHLSSSNSTDCPLQFTIHTPAEQYKYRIYLLLRTQLPPEQRPSTKTVLFPCPSVS
jgi:transposase